MRLGPGLLYEGRTLQGACPKLADFCSATMAEFYSAVDSSTMITSQLPIKAWHDVIGEPTFADAILDRIVHNAYRLELKGPSMRKSVTKMDDENPQT